MPVFNNIRADGGESYVLIVVSADQPRPIVAITEGKSDKRTHFSVRNIWIKKDTSLSGNPRRSRSNVRGSYQTTGGRGGKNQSAKEI